MRISDWSSDVCSSDLPYPCQRLHGISDSVDGHAVGLLGPAMLWLSGHRRGSRSDGVTGSAFPARAAPSARGPDRPAAGPSAVPPRIGDCGRPPASPPGADIRRRSEEHTSELQSLMRISYAVFCLKKKKIKNTHITSKLYYIDNKTTT